MVPQEVPEEEDPVVAEEKPETSETPKADVDEDEVVIEDVTEEVEEKKRKEPELVPVTREEWVQLNSQPPLWMR